MMAYMPPREAANHVDQLLDSSDADGLAPFQKAALRVLQSSVRAAETGGGADESVVPVSAETAHQRAQEVLSVRNRLADPDMRRALDPAYATLAAAAPRATDQAAGGDLAALREWLREQAVDAHNRAGQIAWGNDPDTKTVALLNARGDAFGEVLARLAAAPASEAAIAGEITSVKQLDELAVGTALRDHDGRLYERTRDDCGTWTGAYSRVGRDWPDVPTLPARLLSADAATPRAEGEAAAEEALVTLIDEIGAEVGVAPGQPVLVLSQVRGWMAHGRRANAEAKSLPIPKPGRPAPAGPAPSSFTTVTAAWAQELDDTATYGGGYTDPERNGLRAAARMMRDTNVRARVHSTIGGDS